MPILSTTDAITLRDFAEEATKFIKHFRNMQPTPDEDQVIILARTINTYAHAVLPIKQYSDEALHDAIVERAKDMMQYLSTANTGLTHVLNKYRARFNNYITHAHRNIISKELHDDAIRHFYNIAKTMAAADAVSKQVELTDGMIAEIAHRLMRVAQFDPDFIPTVEQPTKPAPRQRTADTNEPSVGINQFILASEKKS